MVCVTALEKFLNFLPSLLSLLKQHWGKTSRLSKVVLWVPQGKKPLAFEQWGERFYAQLQEESEEDCTFLRRVSRCARVLEWGERVEDIPAAWFAKSTGSPRVYPVDELPFTEDEKLHLQECTDCREEAYDQLQRRAEMRWEMLCPSVDDLAAWLEAQEADPRLAAHLADCGLCRETVKRQAWLWEGAGLLSAEQVDAKLAAVGLVEPPVVVAWLVTTLA